MSPDSKLLVKEKIEARAAKPVVKQAVKPDTRHLFSARLIMRVLFWLGVAYLAVSLAYPFFSSKKISLAKVSAALMAPEVEKLSDPKPYEAYADVLSKRRLFETKAIQAREAPGRVSQEMFSSLHLVGIFTSGEAKAIIEDTKAQKTYYMVQGQFIDDIEIKDIQKEKVILDYKGQSYELHM